MQSLLLWLSGLYWVRHIHPYCLYCGYVSLLMILGALWWRPYLGLWTLLPISMGVLWLWQGPRLLEPPKTSKRWASRAVLGIRVWRNRKQIPIGAEHLDMVRIILGLLSGTWLMLFTALILQHSHLAVAGFSLLLLSQSWFLDRMVWLFDDMARNHADYNNWLY
ncbi:hypothetical protein P2G88_03790 [Aliiglaciecola sp. CAU 1673]|uniref:DUF6653 family protein n=1 Tax=Aliiglaciecola sp. CAU 1673 TaxID=3032595 RepID=UPI0023DC85AD|nr:DUF6653 family protein [Aliiglaciecola sp. CAU 1673]MDF2177366.1 hypothetical protein [Aliiglaciecola sp. CAU 1673]